MYLAQSGPQSFCNTRDLHLAGREEHRGALEVAPLLAAQALRLGPYLRVGCRLLLDPRAQFRRLSDAALAQLREFLLGDLERHRRLGGHAERALLEQEPVDAALHLFAEPTQLLAVPLRERLGFFVGSVRPLLLGLLVCMQFRQADDLLPLSRGRGDAGLAQVRLDRLVDLALLERGALFLDAPDHALVLFDCPAALLRGLSVGRRVGASVERLPQAEAIGEQRIEFGLVAPAGVCEAPRIGWPGSLCWAGSQAALQHRDTSIQMETRIGCALVDGVDRVCNPADGVAEPERRGDLRPPTLQQPRRSFRQGVVSTSESLSGALPGAADLFTQRLEDHLLRLGGAAGLV
jgi:hypothetical protein